jgi:hypothetical protein
MGWLPLHHEVAHDSSEGGTAGAINGQHMSRIPPSGLQMCAGMADLLPGASESSPHLVGMGHELVELSFEPLDVGHL